MEYLFKVKDSTNNDYKDFLWVNGRYKNLIEDMKLSIGITQGESKNFSVSVKDFKKIIKAFTSLFHYDIIEKYQIYENLFGPGVKIKIYDPTINNNFNYEEKCCYITYMEAFFIKRRLETGGKFLVARYLSEDFTFYDMFYFAKLMVKIAPVFENISDNDFVLIVEE